MRIPRFRTIIRLISGPAIIAGSLATFTLASAGPAAAGQPVTQTLSRRRHRRLRPARRSGTGSSVTGHAPSPTAQRTRESCAAAARGASTSSTRASTTSTRSASTAPGRRPHPAYHLRPVRLPIHQSAHRRGDPLQAAQQYHRHPRRPRRPRLGQRNDHRAEQLHGPAHGSCLSERGRTAVFGADGTLEFSAGPQGFIDFDNGNTAALDELCTALGQLRRTGVDASSKGQARLPLHRLWLGHALLPRLRSFCSIRPSRKLASRPHTAPPILHCAKLAQTRSSMARSPSCPKITAAAFSGQRRASPTYQHQARLSAERLARRDNSPSRPTTANKTHRPAIYPAHQPGPVPVNPSPTARIASQILAGVSCARANPDPLATTVREDHVREAVPRNAQRSYPAGPGKQ